jgi:pyruvate,water dikinase
MAAQLGGRLVVAGALAQPDDVYWLMDAELQQAAGELDAGGKVAPRQDVVVQRRATWRERRRLTPPSALPLKDGVKFFGIDFSRLMPARTDQAAGTTFGGIGASPGRIAAPASVLHGPEDFDRMRPGTILVAKITTPAWTPLFALAAGVVTDVGGPLSHS